MRSPLHLGWQTLTCLMLLVGCPNDEEPATPVAAEDTGVDTAASNDVGVTIGTDAGTTDTGVEAPDTTIFDVGADTSVVETDTWVEDVSDVALSDVVLADVLTDASDDTADAGPAEEDVPSYPDALGSNEPDGPVVVLDTALPVDEANFPLGVSAGAARHDSVMFWTKYTGDQELRLKVWRDIDIAGQVVLAYDEVVTPADGGFAKVRVSGLIGDKLYDYAFFADGKRSQAGLVRTALAPGDSRAIRFAATSCTASFFQPWQSLSLMAGYDLDAVLHVGDMSYNDGAVSLEEYRNVWADTLSQSGYRDLLSTAGLYVTWDDHEVDNNWSPESTDPTQIANAKAAYFETLPNDEGPDQRLWNSYQWGDAVELFILDCRAERKPSTIGFNPDPDIYISQAQMDWLKQGLSESTATYKVIMNSVPITDMPNFYFAEDDRWEGYNDQREELLQHIDDNNIPGVWFIAGDFHLGFVSWVDEDGPDGPGENIREIAVGPGGNYNPAGLIQNIFPDAFPAERFDFFHGNPEATTIITFDPDNETVHVEFINALTGDVMLDKEYPGVLVP